MAGQGEIVSQQTVHEASGSSENLGEQQAPDNLYNLVDLCVLRKRVTKAALAISVYLTVGQAPPLSGVASHHRVFPNFFGSRMRDLSIYAVG
jgi:hypothetical protein